MDLSALLIDFDSVLAMGLTVLSAYAGIWSLRKVICLARDSDYPVCSPKDTAREMYHEREALYRDGWTDREYRLGYKKMF